MKEPAVSLPRGGTERRRPSEEGPRLSLTMRHPDLRLPASGTVEKIHLCC